MIQQPLFWVYIQKLWKLIWKDTCRTPILIAPLSVTAKTWEQPKCSSTEWFKKMWYTYTVGYHAAIEKNEILLLAETWIKLENITLSKSNKDKYYIT